MWMGFAAFGFRFLHSSANFEEVLEREDITIEEVLDNDDVLLEVRGANPKLMEFIDRERFLKLVDYITVEPTPEDDKKRQFKFPFVGSEFFGADCHDILCRFFDDQELLDRLFKFLHTDEALNLTLAGYFSKAVQNLLRKNPHFMMEYLCLKNSYATDLAKHVYSTSISDLVDKILVVCIEGYTETKLQIIDSLLEKIDPAYTMEESHHSSLLISSLINRHSNIADGETLILRLASTDNLKFLFQQLFCSTSWVARSAAAILKHLIPVAGKESSDDEAAHEENGNPVCDVLIEVMPRIVAYLESRSTELQNSTHGMPVIPVKEDKLYLIDIIISGCKLSNDRFVKTVVDTKAILAITGLFLENIWNSAIHNLYEILVRTVLSSENPDLYRSLIEDASLPMHLVQIGTEPTIILPNGVEVRKGYLGHITRLSNLLAEQEKSYSYLKIYLENLVGWEEYKATTLAQVNETETCQLGGRNPRGVHNSQSEEEDSKDYLSLDSSSLSQSRHHQQHQDQNQDEDEEIEEDLSNEMTELDSDLPLSIEDLSTSSPVSEVIQDHEYNANIYWKVMHYGATSDLEDLE